MTNTALPLDKIRKESIQVGRLTTDEGGSSILITSTITNTAQAVNNFANAVYLFTADIPYYIRIQHTGGTVGVATNASLLIPVGYPVITEMTSGSNISIIRSGSSDGTLTIARL